MLKSHTPEIPADTGGTNPTLSATQADPQILHRAVLHRLTAEAVQKAKRVHYQLVCPLPLKLKQCKASSSLGIGNPTNLCKDLCGSTG